MRKPTGWLRKGLLEVPPHQFAAIPISAGKNLIKKQLEQRHRARWTACTGYRQSKVLVRYLLPSRASELLAMNKSRLRGAVGLLTGHTSLRAHLHKLGHTEGQECRLCGYEKEDSVHIVCDCPVLACKRYRIFGCMFLKPEDLEKVRVSSLLSLVANTGLGLVS
jgi:predicted Zn-ribbon and HTH transcriptional regulator